VCFPEYTNKHWPVYGDPFVSIGSGVFVPESHYVTQLVDHDAKLVAVLPDGDGLNDAAGEDVTKCETAFSCLCQRIEY
jgi:hypothetical protein